jgi:hypothetical protein
MKNYQPMYEACKLQAQIHAQEATTANSTIAEIYQLVTGSSGEPGNWNGAAPIRKLIAERNALLRAARKVLKHLNDRIDQAVSEGGHSVPVFDGIAELHTAIEKTSPPKRRRTQ